MVKLEYVILDLEWNGSYSKRRKKFINEIIEFGAIKFDEDFNVIDEFSYLVKPQIGKRLSNIVGELTSISMEDLNLANNTFTHIYSKFKDFIKDTVVLTWGTGDIRTLIENVDYYLKTQTIENMDYYMDVQAYVQEMLGDPENAQQLGLVAAAERIGIEFETDTLHRALDDSRLTLMCFEQMYHPEQAAELTQAADEEFYKKIMFKTTYLSNINSPLIDREKLKFSCPKCRCEAEQRSDWITKNKGFQAEFYCDCCGHEFVGRVQYKLKYEGVIARQTSRPFVPMLERENILE